MCSHVIGSWCNVYSNITNENSLLKSSSKHDVMYYYSLEEDIFIYAQNTIFLILY